MADLGYMLKFKEEKPSKKALTVEIAKTTSFACAKVSNPLLEELKSLKALCPLPKKEK